MNLQPNDTLRQGQYLIKRIIGEGGFGITYEALHINFNDSVVIKTPNKNLQNEPDYPKFIQRFRQEGQIVFKLRHPHIVRVTDLFDENNLPCLVMEYVAGENLYDYVNNNGILTEEKALKYINQIGSALQKVHELQPDNPLIHRDVTPLNIMINDEDNAILIDFGIAGELQSKLSTTRAFGNPLFAPHEQWRGIKHPTIDIYTLAGSFYFCLTGKPPEFNHDGDLIEPKILNNSISDHVNNTIIKALQIKPSLRPQTMKEWLGMLDNKSQSKPSTVYRHSYVEKQPKSSKIYSYNSDTYNFINDNTLDSLIGTWQGESGFLFGKCEIILFIDKQSGSYFYGYFVANHWHNGKAKVLIEGNIYGDRSIHFQETKVIEGYWRLGKFKGKLSDDKNEINGYGEDEKGEYKVWLKKV